MPVFPRRYSAVILSSSLALASCSGGELTFASRGQAGAAGTSGGAAGQGGAGHGGGAGGAGGRAGGGACQPCTTDADCPGARCAQLPADSFCVAGCHTDTDCLHDQTCMMLTSAEGAQIQACVALAEPCSGGAGAAGQGGAAGQAQAGQGGSGPGGAGGGCGALVAPEVTSCCHSCGGPGCQPNGCYGGWFCNQDACKCQPPPGAASCGVGAAGAAGGPAVCAGPVVIPTGGPVTAQGGQLDALRFAIVGDTRPASKDDTAAYPSAIIQKIWQQVEGHQVPFAITTGDYMFADAAKDQASVQLDLYLCARSAFSGVLFPALGNHECTGATASNCGPGGKDGVTKNYSVFLDKMLAPLGLALPYYTVRVNGTGGAWSAKFVFVAANAWTTDQATWLEGELAQPTTYTFVVRHEGSSAKNAPGVVPSDTIMAKHPYTLLLAGHTHTFDYSPSQRQVITGNGGAPLSGSYNYGYVIVEQQPDGTIAFAARDYQTTQAFRSFAVKADGTPAP